MAVVYLYKRNKRWRVGPSYEQDQCWLYTKSRELDATTKWYKKGKKVAYS